MELPGEKIIPRKREDVWAALTDPDVLRRCIPGCTHLVRETEVNYSLEVALRFGPMETRFRGEMRIEDADYPASYTLKAFGQGGGAGDAIGQAELALHQVSTGGQDSTRLRYRMVIDISGNLMRLGERLVYVVAKRMTSQFFRRFQEINRTGGNTAIDPSTAEEIQRMIDQALSGEGWK